MGQTLQSPEETVAEMVGISLSEGFLVLLSDSLCILCPY